MVKRSKARTDERRLFNRSRAPTDTLPLRTSSAARSVRDDSVTPAYNSIGTEPTTPPHESVKESTDLQNSLHVPPHPITDGVDGSTATETKGEAKKTIEQGAPVEPLKKETKLQKCLNKCLKRKKIEKLSPDIVIVMSVYSSICGIASVYTSVTPVAMTGPLGSFLCVTIVGLLFTYSIILIVLGLRPNDVTMLDEILGERIPKAKIPLQVLGQFTSGFMMIVGQFLGFEMGGQTLEMAFFKKESERNYKISCIITFFLAVAFSNIFNPSIFVPLVSLPTFSTIFGFIVTIWWVCKNTTAKDLHDYAYGWAHPWGDWAVSSKAGGTAFLELVGVLASVFYLHSMIQQVLVNAKHPEHNIINTFWAFLLSIITMLFTNFVADLPFGSYNGGLNGVPAPETNLILNMGMTPLVRANNILMFLLGIPVAPLSWAVIRQNTIELAPWHKFKYPKWKLPIVILYQLIIIGISMAIGWFQPPLQILLQVSTFPAAIYWVCFLPVFFHIYTMSTDPVLKKKWYYIPWCIWDVFVAGILTFCEIIQFIPTNKW